MGAVVAIVAATSVVAWLRLAPSGSTPTQVSAAEAERVDSRAARDDERASAPPSPSPKTPEPLVAVPLSSKAPTPSSSAPSPPKAQTQPQPGPPAGGTVVSSETCGASFYTDEGQLTANGEIFHVNLFTAAHKTLPFNTRVRVTNLGNGKSTVVRINDRGPFIAGRCIDLTPAAFNTIANAGAGVANVRVDVLKG